MAGCHQPALPVLNVMAHMLRANIRFYFRYQMFFTISIKYLGRRMPYPSYTLCIAKDVRS